VPERPNIEMRGYQYDFSSAFPAMRDTLGRERKARTMVAVLADVLGGGLHALSLLNVGGSMGIIDNFLAEHFGKVVGVDIDATAIEHAQRTYRRDNLAFQVGDAMALDFADDVFDVVVCSHVYEHVPDASRMMAEIFRVLKPGAVCYFAAANRLVWTEPHYGLPLLSVLPRRLAHVYIRLAGKAQHYHELHFTYWGLRKLVERFELHDYTRRILADPDAFGAGYMLRRGTAKARVAAAIARHAYWLLPSYVWLLRKPPGRA
jgi:ubiquinone/menaquinone biosynthesis C-methylase UbiE